MQQRYLPESRLRWTRRGVKTPVWPTEPDCAAITRLAGSALACSPDLLNVRFFAQGAVNKLFEVRHKPIDNADQPPPVYLFRVSLPVDPFYKTESEVATLKYLGVYTGIPVATVIAWDSSPNNELGYEWILLEKLAGVELRRVWRKMHWDKKLNLARSLAEYSMQLWSREFATIGSLYLDGWEACKDYAFGTEGHARASDSNPCPGKMNAGFVVGPIVAPFYFEQRRLYIPSNRGPYVTSQDYMKEKIILQSSYASTETGLLKSVTNKEVLDELDEDYLKDGDSIIELCKGYMEALPTIFPAYDSLAEGPFVLCHEDLNQRNILVDPESFAITGLIDWEMISIIPLWQARSFPKLFDGMDLADSIMFGESDEARLLEEPPRPENYDIEDSDSIHSGVRSYAISKRDEWENWLLRKAFSEALAPHGVHFEASASEKRKHMFADGVSALNDDWTYAQILWEEDFKSGDA